MFYTSTTIDSNTEELTIPTDYLSENAPDRRLVFRIRIAHTSRGYVATIPAGAQAIKLDCSTMSDYDALIEHIFSQIARLALHCDLPGEFSVNSGGFFNFVATWQGWSIVASSDPHPDLERWSIMFSKPGRPVLHATFKDLDFGLHSLREYVVNTFEHAEVASC